MVVLGGGRVVLRDSEDSEEIIERVAALDIGKAELVACIRVPNPDRPGRRAQEITTYSTMTRSLLGLAHRLHELGVSRVVMEATSDYWKPVVRHEALGNRAGVKGLRGWSVAAGR
jgi:transposase